MSYIQLIIWCLFNIVTNFEAARILAVFPAPSISHQVVFRPLTQELAKRGHNVTVITPDPAYPAGQSIENLKEIDVHDISYSTWIEELKTSGVSSATSMEDQVVFFLHLFSVIPEQQLLTKEVQELIRNKDLGFDLILVEACVRPALIYSHIIKAPVIQVSSFGPSLGTNSAIGATNHPLLHPLFVRQRSYNLKWWEKIRETYRQYKFEYINYKMEHAENMMLKRIFGPDTPTLSELHKNVDMVFVNVHPIWNDNAPVPPGLIYIGGLHQQPIKELPMDLQSYMDASKKGIIYLSFGTNVQSSAVPTQTVKIIMKVFSELPYDVIWKWDADLFNKTSNIRVMKWLPQSDILRHPNLKLFVTQGGLQSTQEAIDAGVPLIGIPVLADQWFNVEKYVKLGIGKQLEMGEFSEDEFRNAVVTVIENPSYRMNIQRLRDVMHDEPQTPLERAVWWTEYVLRHGGAKHLRSPAANMSWAEYYELQLVSIVLLCCSIITITLITALYYLQRYISKNLYSFVKTKTS